MSDEQWVIVHDGVAQHSYLGLLVERAGNEVTLSPVCAYKSEVTLGPNRRTLQMSRIVFPVECAGGINRLTLVPNTTFYFPPGESEEARELVAHAEAMKADLRRVAPGIVTAANAPG